MKKSYKILLAIILPLGIFVPAITVAATLIHLNKDTASSEEKNNVDKINERLQRSAVKFETMFSVVQYLEKQGIDLESLAAVGNNQYVWDAEKNVVFTLKKDNTVSNKPESYVLNTNKQMIWKMVNLSSSNGKIETFDKTNDYAQYIRKDQTCTDELAFSTSIDTGYNQNYKLVYDKPTVSTSTFKPVINTNKSTNLDVKGSINDVHHYGSTISLTVTELETNTKYYEHGTVEGNVVVKSGTFNAQPGSNTNTIILDSNDANVVVEVKDEAIATVGTVTKTENVTKTVEELVDDSAILDESKKPTKDNAPITPTSDFAGGLGTFKSPYLIASKTHLETAANLVNAQESIKTFGFKLVSDIDLGGTDWKPIGYDVDHPFIGLFDGNGFTIKDFVVKNTERETQKQYFAGLFGVIGSKDSSYANTQYTAYTDIWNVGEDKLDETKIDESNYKIVVKNLNIEKVNCKLETEEADPDLGYLMGGLAGDVRNAYISNINVKSGEIYGTKHLGGVVGTMSNSILKDCVVGSDSNDDTITITAKRYNVGGVVGSVSYSTGLNGNSAILNCETKPNCNISTENAKGGYVAGIVAFSQVENSFVVDNCINNASISVTTLNSEEVAGISGIGGLMQKCNVIANCVNKGSLAITENSVAKYVAGVAIGYGDYIYNCVNKANLNPTKGSITYGIAGISAGPNGLTLKVNGCINKGSLFYDEQNPPKNVSDLCADIYGLKLSNVTFDTVADLNAALAGYQCEMQITLENVIVNNKEGQLKIPGNVANITSDKPLCSDVFVDNYSSRTNKTLIVDIPNVNIVVTEGYGNGCRLYSNGANSSVTINENSHVASVSVNGENGFIVNKGTIDDSMSISGAASYCENYGTCSGVSLGNSTTNKTFKNYGTVLRIPTTTVQHVISAKANVEGLTFNIENHGTIEYRDTSAGLTLNAYMFALGTNGPTARINFDSYEDSVIKTNSTDGTYYRWMTFSGSPEVYMQYKSTAEVYQGETPKGFVETFAQLSIVKEVKDF